MLISELSYNATTTKFFGVHPYSFFAHIGYICSVSLFILLLLKYQFPISKYTQIFLLSGLGLIIGAKLFGIASGLYDSLLNNKPLSLDIITKTGIVFYGGLVGFLVSFIFLCKLRMKYLEKRVLDLVAVCIPLFHFWGRIGCFFGGCCFGKETDSKLSILYTTRYLNETITAQMIPIQLVEASTNLIIFFILTYLLFHERLKHKLIIVYLLTYAIIRFVLEFYRGDYGRGVWLNMSFSQIMSILLIITVFYINKKNKETKQWVLDSRK